MKNLRDNITQVLKEHPAIEFRFCRVGQYEAVLDSIAERFLSRGRYDLSRIWLWEAFDQITESYVPADVFAEWRKRLHPEESYWFLASDEDGKYWVAEGTGSAIPEILRETPPFEYYIIDRKMSWILCENHHGTLFLAQPRFQGSAVPIA
ncbi:DUF6756 family protein [Haloferula sp. BvORR071]|uniref:DUF6756 family protein n=1 Tax=Haloferula sp. BvORR071 TaxID=1396141 RepID=UPI00055085BE|nr:DUF6756 family protein [Haloferula sp. BvORR071]